MYIYIYVYIYILKHVVKKRVLKWLVHEEGARRGGGGVLPTLLPILKV